MLGLRLKASNEMGHRKTRIVKVHQILHPVLGLAAGLGPLLSSGGCAEYVQGPGFHP